MSPRRERERTCAPFAATVGTVGTVGSSPLKQRLEEGMLELSGRVHEFGSLTVTQTMSMLPQSLARPLAGLGSKIAPNIRARLVGVGGGDAVAAERAAAKLAVMDALRALRLVVMADGEDAGAGGVPVHRRGARDIGQHGGPSEARERGGDADVHVSQRAWSGLPKGVPKSVPEVGDVDAMRTSARGKGVAGGKGAARGGGGGGMEDETARKQDQKPDRDGRVSFVGVTAVVESLDAVLAARRGKLPAAAAIGQALADLRQLREMVAHSSGSRRALASCGGLGTLMGIARLALDGGGSARASKVALQPSPGGGGGEWATELVLETFKVLAEGSMASPSMQADLGALACVQMCVSYLDKVAGPLEADPSAAAMASLAPSQSAVDLCNASCSLLGVVCKGNVLNQRALLVAGGVRRLLVLVRCQHAGAERAAAAALHRVCGQGGTEQRLFQDEAYRCGVVVALVGLLRQTCCRETKRHALEALAAVTRRQHAQNQVAMRASGVLKHLLLVLRTATPDVQVMAIKALEAGCCGQEESWAVVAGEGGAELMCRTLYTGGPDAITDVSRVL